jgi:hypothetical protein
MIEIMDVNAGIPPPLTKSPTKYKVPLATVKVGDKALNVTISEDVEVVEKVGEVNHISCIGRLMSTLTVCAIVNISPELA